MRHTASLRGRCRSGRPLLRYFLGIHQKLSRNPPLSYIPSFVVSFSNVPHRLSGGAYWCVLYILQGACSDAAAPPFL